MKLIKGRTLDAMLRDRGDPAADRGRFLAVFEAICQAVAYAHAQHVIHRDLKPSNVMVGAFGEVQVMDWGLAKVLGGFPGRRGRRAEDSDRALATQIRSARDTDGSETQAGSVLGTPAYMAPEQAVGAVDQVDERSDVFGLGAILAVILTGQPPFVGDGAEATRVMAAGEGRRLLRPARLLGSRAGADRPVQAVPEPGARRPAGRRHRGGGERGRVAGRRRGAGPPGRARPRAHRGRTSTGRGRVTPPEPEAEVTARRGRRTVRVAGRRRRRPRSGGAPPVRGEAVRCRSGREPGTGPSRAACSAGRGY